WRRVEKRQNAAVRLDPVFGIGAAIAGLGKTDEAVSCIAHAPLRRRAGCAAKSASNRARRDTVSGHQHELRLKARPMFTLSRARQALKLDPLISRQYDRCCFRMAAHAALNHDSRIRDSGY